MQKEAYEQPVIIVTGCSGLIGSRLIEDMKRDYQIVGLDVAEPENSPDGWTWMECDLTEDQSVEACLAHVREKFGDRIASVIHLAAYYDFSGEPSDMYEKLTVEGTRRLMEHLKSYGTVKQFIFASSLLAMKPAEETDETLTEESPTHGEWDYPQSKLETERVLKEVHGDIPVVIHRMGGVYNEYGHSLPITQHIRRIYEKQLESFLFPGDPSKGQAFVHLNDIVECFRKTVEKRQELNTWEVFLIAEPEVMSHEELQDVIGELVHGKQWPTIRIPKSAAKAGAWVKEKITREDAFIKPWMIDLADDHYPVQIERARKRIEWEPQHRLRTTLPAIIENLHRDPRMWYEINNLTLPRQLQQRKTAGRS